MAGLIVKSPYIKGRSSGKGAGRYLQYIGTRDGVELLLSGYLEYMDQRPRSHGLFGDEDVVDLDKAMSEMEDYPGNIWTHILSLTREDAARLGYDNAKAWRDLLRTHRNEIAAAMNIPPNDFRWYAAYHDEGEHPHVHMMAWSVVPGQAYLNKAGIRQIRSRLTNDIFRMELLHTYEQKSASRDELVRQARRALLELTRQLQLGICSCPTVEVKMESLVGQLGTVPGKKSYGYLSKPVKKLVDEIVDEMEKLPVVQQCYDQWLALQSQVEGYYHGRTRERKKLSEEKEFRQIKNAVIREAERIRLGQVSFEDEQLTGQDEWLDDRKLSDTCWELRAVIQNEWLPLEDRDRATQELERLADGGDVHAQYIVGTLYRDGPLLTPDWVNARHYFQRAAQQGLTEAQYALGKLLLSDNVEVRDPDEGLIWLRRAAQSGHTYAAYHLGKEYLKGEVVQRDATKAAEWFSQSAEAGNQYAQYMLGKLCLDGTDTEQDWEQARYWFTRAAVQGNEYAQFFLDRHETLRSPLVMLCVTRLIHHMGNIFRETAPTAPSPVGMHIDRKRLQ